MFCDLILIYERFFHRLPTSYEAFKREISDRFPKIYDTKNIANALKRVCVISLTLINYFFKSKARKNRMKINCWTSKKGLIFKFYTKKLMYLFICWSFFQQSFFLPFFGLLILILYWIKNLVKKMVHSGWYLDIVLSKLFKIRLCFG